MVSCIEPLPFTTVDGVERRFRLRAREQALISQKVGADLLAMRLAVALPKMLYECLVDADGMTEDEFLDVLPPDTELLSGFWAALTEHYSGPPSVRQANERYRPTRGATQPANGSNWPPSGEHT